MFNAAYRSQNKHYAENFDGELARATFGQMLEDWTIAGFPLCDHALARHCRLIAAFLGPEREPGLFGCSERVEAGPTSTNSVFPVWRLDRSTRRTAVYGPVRTVVWEGRNREIPPYPD